MPQEKPDFVYTNPEHGNGVIYAKKCRVCGNDRKFCAGTERDKQAVCGNCWVW